MSKKKEKILGTVLVLVILIGAIVGFLFLRRCEKKQPEVKGVETITYITELPYEPDELKDITETSEGEEIYAALEAGKTKAIIPAKSKIFLPFNSLCLDADYDVPNEYMPALFSYEKVDMPLSFEIEHYILEHPDLDQYFLQDLIWGLSSDKRRRFDQLYEDEKQFLLNIHPDAERIMGSYQYYRNISVKSFDFGEDLPDKMLPEEIIAQPIPRTELYIKVVYTVGYQLTDFELYNPSSKAQTFSLFREDQGVLVLVPKYWGKRVIIDGSLSFAVMQGKLDVDLKEKIIRTPSDSGAIVETEEGNQLILEPNSQFSSVEFKEMLEEKNLFPAAKAGTLFWGKNKFQIRQPMSIVAVRG